MKHSHPTKSLKPLAIIIFLLLFACFAALISSEYIHAFASDSSNPTLEKKIFSTATISDQFDDNSILVVLDKSVGGINKKIDLKLFEGVSYKNITDLTYMDNYSEDNEYLDKNNFRQILKIDFNNSSKQNILNNIHILEKIDGIKWVGPNYLHKTNNVFQEKNSEEHDCQEHSQLRTGNNLYDELWGLHGTYGINAEDAWEITTGSIKVNVGIIDSGLAPHNDYFSNLGSGYDFLNNSSLSSSNTSDDIGLGTFTGGIIGARENSTNGFIGVSPYVALHPLMVENLLTLNVSDSNLISAISWASNNEIDILNFGCTVDDNVIPDTYSMETALNAYNGLFVCAAGDSTTNLDSTPIFPACFSQGKSFSDRVICVSAINENGDKISGSNYGATYVNLYAPGGNILSTFPDDKCTGIIMYNHYECELFGILPTSQHIENGYHKNMGVPTHSATAYVTGVAALLNSQMINNKLGLARADISALIKTTILNNVTTDTRYTGYCSSGGRLNAYAALKYCPCKRIMEDFGFSYQLHYWSGRLSMLIDDASAISYNNNDVLTFTKSTDIDFALSTKGTYNAWYEIVSNITFELKNSSNQTINIQGNSAFLSEVRVGLISNVTFTNGTFTINTGSLSNDTYTLYLSCSATRNGVTQQTSDSFTFIVNKSSSCLAAGSLITLADGSQVSVENLTGNESLLVWNMLTGQYDTAPILFIDSDPSALYEVITLTFSDGTTVKVIDEHAFFDMTLGEYVFMRSDASQYIGHYFNKKSGNTWTTVQLTNISVGTETTTAWSPVTYGHLCYYVNGMLSIPGGIEGLVNIFDVDTTLMKYDSTLMASDIATYGLYTYAEFNAIIPTPQILFNAVNGQYLKVAIGKGLITLSRLQLLVDRYAVFVE